MSWGTFGAVRVGGRTAPKSLGALSFAIDLSLLVLFLTWLAALIEVLRTLSRLLFSLLIAVRTVCFLSLVWLVHLYVTSFRTCYLRNMMRNKQAFLPRLRHITMILCY